MEYQKKRLQTKIEILENRIAGNQKNIDTMMTAQKQKKAELKALKSQLKTLEKESE